MKCLRSHGHSYHPPIILLRLALNVNASTIKISNFCPRLFVKLCLLPPPSTTDPVHLPPCPNVFLYERRSQESGQAVSSNSAFSADPLIPTSTIDRELQDHYGFHFLTHVPPFENLNEFLSQPARPSVLIH
jgi:hypothetical protein